MDIFQKLEAVEDAAGLKQALANVSSEAEFFEVLKQHGLELTSEEIEELSKNVNTEDELTEENLDLVSGGSVAILALAIIIVVGFYVVKKHQEAQRRRK